MNLLESIRVAREETFDVGTVPAALLLPRIDGGRPPNAG